MPAGKTINVEHHELYNGEVQLDFNPDSPKYRYVVTDRRNPEVNGASIRGVTSILRDIVAKPDLMTWPMNMSHQYLFGTKFDEITKEYVHDWKKAILQPDTPYTIEDLHNMMMDGSKQWVTRSDKGKDVGTMTHDAIETFLKTVEGAEVPLVDSTIDKYREGLEDTDEARKQFEENAKCVRKAYKAFTDWWNGLAQKRVLATEKVIYSRGMQYCGTFDLYAEINGKTYLLDVKTTNSSKKAPMGIYAEYFLQLGAYSWAMREETGMEVDDVGIIRVGKDGKLHVATAVDIGSSRDECERSFAFAVRVHDFLGKVTPFVSDVHFKSHLLPTPEVEQGVSINNEEA